MLPAKRRAKILEVLRREKMASIKDLSDVLGISVSTVRRDVEYLAESGHLSRTHGGAMVQDTHFTTFEPEPEIATAMEGAAKTAIGRRAAELILPGQTVIFDSGTTTMAAAKAARARGIGFTAFTNDLGIATVLSGNPAIQTHISAGYVRPGTGTLLGAAAVQSVGRLRADLAFIGTHAMTVDDVSDTSIELAEIKRAIISATDKAILLVDSSKMDHRAFCAFGRTSELALIITDSRIAPVGRAAFEARGLPLDIVDEALG